MLRGDFLFRLGLRRLLGLRRGRDRPRLRGFRRGRRHLPHGVELVLDLGRDRNVRGVETPALLHAPQEFGETADGIREHRQHLCRQRWWQWLQREQALLECAGGHRNQRKSARAMDPAERVGCTHHRRRRRLPGIELQQRQFARECGEMNLRLVDQHSVELRRHDDVADGDDIGRRRDGFFDSGTGGHLAHRRKLDDPGIGVGVVGCGVDESDRLRRCSHRKDFVRRQIRERLLVQGLQGRQLGHDAADGCTERRRIGVDVTGVLERSDPRAEIRLGNVEKLEHRRRHIPILFQQAVVKLLDVVGELAEPVQADHQAAALERVELPARRAQRLAIAWIRGELCAIPDNVVEYLGGLDEEDLEELGVEPVGVGGQEPLRLCRQRGGGRCDGRSALGNRRDRGLQGDSACGVLGVRSLDFGERRELGQRFLRLLDKLRVVDQRRVID